ncbi:hypothetical protein GIB67_037970, partial [Kingdonia uniflora]
RKATHYQLLLILLISKFKFPSLTSNKYLTSSFNLPLHLQPLFPSTQLLSPQYVHIFLSLSSLIVKVNVSFVLIFRCAIPRERLFSTPILTLLLFAEQRIKLSFRHTKFPVHLEMKNGKHSKSQPREYMETTTMNSDAYFVYHCRKTNVQVFSA